MKERGAMRGISLFTKQKTPVLHVSLYLQTCNKEFFDPTLQLYHSGLDHLR